MSGPFDEVPQGYTKAGMQKGWFRPQRAPGYKKLKEENKKLKKALDSVLERLEKIEQDKQSE